MPAHRPLTSSYATSASTRISLASTFGPKHCATALTNVQIGWMGVFAPAGTPPDVIQRLNGMLVKVLQTPEVNEMLTERGVKVVASSSEEYRRKLATERDRWQKVVRDAGISLTE